MRRKRVIAAGIEHDQSQLGSPSDNAEDAPKRDGLLVGSDIDLELGINRDQLVLASNLHAVTGEKRDRHFCIGCLVPEIEQGPTHIVEAGIHHRPYQKSQTLE